MSSNNLFMNTILETIGESVHNTLNGTILTLGEFIKKLESFDPELKIVFAYPENDRGRLDYGEYKRYDDSTLGLGRFDSYRGYYQYLAIEPTEKVNTVGEVLAEARGVVEDTFHGYKGGDYRMTLDTYVWCAHWGHATELKIVDLVKVFSSHANERPRVVVLTAFENDEDYDYEAMGEKAQENFQNKVKTIIG